MSNILTVEDLHVDLVDQDTARTIVRHATLSVGPGESIGLVGESGSGKSTTANAIVRALPSSARVTGSVEVLGQEVYRMTRGELRSMRAHTVAVISQSPRASMNPLRTVGDFGTEALRTHNHVSRAYAADLVGGVLKDIGIPNPAEVLAKYPHQLSGGMLQRVVIAAAVAMEPSLVIADEPTSGLDASTQAEVMGLLADLQRSRGMAMLFITHDLDLAAATCDRTAVMYAGAVVEEQDSLRLQHDPRHPYTQGLLGARTPTAADVARLAAIPGRPIAAFEAGPGCAFAPRCAFARGICNEQPPTLATTEQGRVACWFHADLSLSHGAPLTTLTSVNPGDPA